MVNDAMQRVKDGERRTSPPPADRAAASRRWTGAVGGVLSGALAVGIAQLVAGFVGGASSPVIAVGGAVIDASPEWLKNFAIAAFGTNDKLALLVGIGVILAVVAAVVGAASVRRPAIGIAAIACLGAVGVLAAVTRPGAGAAAWIPSVVGAAAGAGAFVRLRRAAAPLSARPGGGRRDPERPEGSPPGFDRRRFLLASGVAAGLAAATGFAGQYLVRRTDASASRAAARIPPPVDAAPPPPPGADLDIPGLSPFITPNDQFYRVDTALLVPAVDAASWQLRVHGMVDREISISYRDLLARPLIERDITLACVSNPVGGHYIGNARWIGARLKDLLDEAGVHPGATQIVSRSSDGFTVGTPTAIAMDGRDSMLAVAMNGQPLQLEHGFPVRMIVPGLYGYVSATKWIVDIELTTFQAYSAYWVQRGWSQQAPIKTESRIDTPHSSAKLRAGRVPIAGVAWAQHRGIEAVQVRIDDGPWTQAELAAQDTVDTWRQWVSRWDATPGRHQISVRATDGTGAVQTPARSGPPPNGATGDHTIVVSVS